MKNQQNKLVFIPSTSQLHSSCYIQGDVILGSATSIKKNTVINTQQNTIIIGANVKINEEVKVTSYGPEGYTYICNNVTIDKGAHICNATLEDGVKIGNRAVILENCFVAQGAEIGANTIVTPHSRVLEDQICEPNSIYSGNPAVKICTINPSSQNIQRAFRSSMFSQVV